MAVSGEEIENLAEDILEDIELSRISLAAAMLKCARLARWLGDEQHRQLFAYEAGGYPNEPSGTRLLSPVIGPAFGLPLFANPPARACA
jgi:hypothetical protein